MCKVIYLGEKTYNLIKRYTEMMISQDKLSKSYEDRLLDLLAKEVSVRHFKPSIDILNKIFHSEPSQFKIPFALREQTLDLLCLYTYLRQEKDFDEALSNLLEPHIDREILDQDQEKKLSGILMVRFPFRCTNCNYGMSLISGIPSQCPICKESFCFTRITWDEYEKLEITDGFDEKCDPCSKTRAEIIAMIWPMRK